MRRYEILRCEPLQCAPREFCQVLAGVRRETIQSLRDTFTTDKHQALFQPALETCLSRLLFAALFRIPVQLLAEPVVFQRTYQIKYRKILPQQCSPLEPIPNLVRSLSGQRLEACGRQTNGAGVLG